MIKKMNSKVRNATPLIHDGIKFRSKLEVYCYQRLKESNIQAIYEGKTFVLVPAFTFNNEKIRKMTFTPDFVGEYFIIECKGMMNDVFPVKYKLFKYYLYKHKIKYDLYLPRNRRDVDSVIIKLKETINNG